MTPPLPTESHDINTIMIALDGSEHSDHAIPLLRWLLRSSSDLRVHLLRVLEPFKPSSAAREELEGRGDPHLDHQFEAARGHLEELCARFANQAASVTASVLMGSPVERILAEAEHVDADLVVMVTKGRSGPLRWIKGSVTEEVMRRTEVPLLLYNPSVAPERDPELSYGSRILFAVDSSGLARAAFGATAALARALGARVTIYTCRPLHFSPPLPGVTVAPPPFEEDEAATREALEPWRVAFALRGVEATVAIGRGDPVMGILSAAEGADLIALTTHGHQGLERFVLGSVTESVLRAAKQPLLVARADASAIPATDQLQTSSS